MVLKPRFEEIAFKRTDDYPNRPTIVFLHDSLGCIQLWRDFPYRLGQLTQCNVLIYDRQGYGESCPFSYVKRDNSYMEVEADLLHGLLSFWDIKDAILFGHSDGGSIALIMAGKYPDKIRAIITEGAHIFVEEITINGIKAAIRIYKLTNLKQKLEKYHGDKTEAMFWAWASTWTTEAFRNWNIEVFLPKIQCPTLIIQGEADEYGSLKQVERIITQINGPSEQLVIPAVKHTPHKEVPEQILDKVRVFIETLLEPGD